MADQEREQPDFEGQSGRRPYRNEEAPENPQETSSDERGADDPDVEGQAMKVKRSEDARQTPQESTGEKREDDDPDVEGQSARVKY